MKLKDIVEQVVSSVEDLDELELLASLEPHDELLVELVTDITGQTPTTKLCKQVKAGLIEESLKAVGRA